MRPKREPAGSKVPGLPQQPSVGNGHTLAKVTDPKGFVVVVDIETWEHIQDRHPEIRSLAAVKAVLAKPQLIRRYDHGGHIRLYYRLARRRLTRSDDLYVAVVVGEDDSMAGSVRTAYLWRKMKSYG